MTRTTESAQSSVPYELALRVGSTADFQARCEHLLPRLLASRGLTSAVVWLCNTDTASQAAVSSSEGARLVYAHPGRLKESIAIPRSHPALLACSRDLCVRASDSRFQELVLVKDFARGLLLFLPLPGVGFLSLHCATRTTAYTKADLRALRATAQKLAQSLAACLAYAALGCAYEVRQGALASRRLQARALEALVVSLPELVSLKDAEGRWVLANSPLREFLGLGGIRYEGLMSEQIAFEVPRAEATLLASVVAEEEALRAGTPIRYKLEAQRYDGVVRNLECRQIPILEEGGARLGVAMIARDTTDSRRQEALWQPSQAQVEQGNRLESLGRLVGGIAYDFNNLITVILGNLGLAQEGLPFGSLISEDLSQAHDAAVRGAALVRQLLDFAGKAPRRVETFDCNHAIAEMARLLKPTIPTNVSVRLELPSEPVHVTADALQVRQIILNLLSNAIEALEGKGGRVVVRAGSASVQEGEEVATCGGTTLAPGQYSYLEVSDNGIGLSDSMRARVFEAFYSTKATGRGLGLPVVLGILGQSHGALTLQSAPGVGSTFRVYLPKETLRAPVRLEVVSPSVRTRSVLVADDEPRILRSTRRVLEAAGVPVLTSESVAEALELYAHHNDAIGLVLADVSMPGDGGVGLVRQLRARGSQVPVLLTSGYGREVLEGTEDLAVDFLPKPWKGPELAQRVKQAMDGARNRS